MTIGSVDAASVAALHEVADSGGRKGSAEPQRQPVPAPPTKAVDESAASAAETTRAVPPVALPEFTQYELSFRLDEERGRVVVQVIDAKTGSVVRTVPPDELRRALPRQPQVRGLLLDRRS
jgi:hypothetical protein